MDKKKTAAMRTDGKINSLKKVMCGVKHGCMLSPDLISLYNETIMRKLEEYPEIKVGGHKVNNLRYADDTV